MLSAERESQPADMQGTRGPTLRSSSVAEERQPPGTILHPLSPVDPYHKLFVKKTFVPSHVYNQPETSNWKFRLALRDLYSWTELTEI